MKHAPFLLGAVLIFALNVRAQVNPNYSLPKVSLTQDTALSSSSLPSSGSTLLASSTLSGGLFPESTPNSLAASPADPQRPNVYGVFQNYSLQIYAGYSFFRFYISSKPSLTENMNGLDFGGVYYPHAGWIGVEGQFLIEFGSLFKDSSKLALLSGGARFRWSAPRGAEIWGHALVSHAKFLPQTALGGQTAFGFVVGAGADLGSHRSRFAIRVEGDLVGTRFFSTYQYSPRFAVGIVYKF